MSTELNGIKISALPAQPELTGNEMVPFASGGTNGRFALKQIFDRINDAVKSLAPSSDVTALRNLLNSLQSRLDTLVNGNTTAVIDTFTEIESFLAGVTNKETLTGLLAELKTQVQSYADDGLAGKVDKEYIDRLSVRFTLVGYINENGAYTGSGELAEDLTDWTNKSACTDFMPLNRYHDVKIFSRCTPIHSVIAFYDGSLNFISNVVTSGIEADFTQKTISKDTFPTGAVFFRCSSYVGQDTIMPKCDNGESVGSREGAMVNAIGKAKENLQQQLDAYRAQLLLPGYYSTRADSLGQLINTDPNNPNANYWNSGLIPLDRLNDIVVSKAQVDENYFVISFFDNAQNFISGIKGEKNVREYKALKEEFPSNAIYFAVSSWIIKSTQSQSN